MIADYHCVVIIDRHTQQVNTISECLRLVDGSPWDIFMTSTMHD